MPKRIPKKVPVDASRATTTPLVAHFFESVFGTEMMESSCTKSTQGCGQCSPCQAIDCGSCAQCLKMKKFSGDVNDHLLIVSFSFHEIYIYIPSLPLYT